MTPDQVLAMSAAFAAEHVTGVTGGGPTTKRHRGAGASLRALEPLTVAQVAHAREWALSSGMAAALPADAPTPGRVPIVLPSGEVARAEASGLNAAALLAAQMCAAAEAAVLLGILQGRIKRIAALERLRGAVAQVEALDGGEG
jgi:hypothetical protein